MGSKLGPNVVVAVGYNDFEDQYAQNIETALGAVQGGRREARLVADATGRAPWLPHHERRHHRAAQNHPEMSVIDWNVYSRSHPEWFQDDGLHLLAGGSEAMARLIHQQLVTDGIAPSRSASRPASCRSHIAARPYSRNARAARTAPPPYRWSLLERAPEGLHLLAGGRSSGKPHAKPGATCSTSACGTPPARPPPGGSRSASGA